jgi:hypothetical protein
MPASVELNQLNERVGKQALSHGWFLWSRQGDHFLFFRFRVRVDGSLQHLEGISLHEEIFIDPLDDDPLKVYHREGENK